MPTWFGPCHLCGRDAYYYVLNDTDDELPEALATCWACYQRACNEAVAWRAPPETLRRPGAWAPFTNE